LKIVRGAGGLSRDQFPGRRSSAQTALMLANSEEESWNSVDDVRTEETKSPESCCEEDETSAGRTVFPDSLALMGGVTSLGSRGQPVRWTLCVFAASHLAFGRPFAFHGLAREPL